MFEDTNEQDLDVAGAQPMPTDSELTPPMEEPVAPDTDTLPPEVEPNDDEEATEEETTETEEAIEEETAATNRVRDDWPMNDEWSITEVEPTEERVGFLSINGPLIEIQLEKHFIRIVEYRGMLANRDQLNKIFAEYTDGVLQLSEECGLIVNGEDVGEWKYELSF